jgi:hypothetical protein
MLRLQEGKHAEAAAAADELPKIFPNRWEEPFYAAEFLARCMRLAEKDAMLAGEKRRELMKTYEGRAVALLRTAIANGYRDAAALENNPAFAALQDCKEFQDLLRQLREKAKVGGKP